LFIGPIFSREAVVAPRRPRHFIIRTVYGISLLVLICTAWLLLTNTQDIQNAGDMARFGSIMFQILAPLQLALLMFLAAIQAASNIAIEKDKETLILLLMSRMTNSELVLGKLFSSLLYIASLMLTSLPIFMLIVLFGGTSFTQVGWTFAVTGLTALAAGSLGAIVALWREKTFQTLALVAMAIVFWIGTAEALALSGVTIAGLSGLEIAEATNPFRAVINASHPTVTSTWLEKIIPFLSIAGGLSILLSIVAILKVRRWNPSRDVRMGQKSSDDDIKVDMFTGKLVDDDADGEAETGKGAVRESEKFRTGHVDARQRTVDTKTRKVWDNPVLWREVRTWAYGKKILFIRAVFWVLAACVFFALYSMVSSGEAFKVVADAGTSIPITAKPLMPFMLLSLVMVNALAVTSITNERDGRSLDLLRVTDISPKEFLFGKLLGVLTISADMILLPIVLAGYLWYSELLTGEHLLFLIIGFAALQIFVVMLGIHCGMSYNSSRQGIGASLGTVFFLSLGVVTTILMMISFTGNVEGQLAPFLAFLIGGAIGLFVTLGYNMPSKAIAIASGLLPLAMFYSFTGAVLKSYLAVLIVIVLAYGFTTFAMMLPRLNEWLVSSGRARASGDA
jgi:ABC-type transport system involved in multi-copper enzyme maturation permease subunit